MNRAALPDAMRPRFACGGVGALMSTRAGGVSVGPYAFLNLGASVGDHLQSVGENRARFADALGGAPVWLRQVHGTGVVRLHADAPLPLAPPEADASVCTQPGRACVVQVADCLPVLFAAPGGRGVAAAHAGWRGLSAGVLEATLDVLCAAADCRPQDIEAWLGPCIGPRQFEVGADVLRGFGVEPERGGPRFTPHAEGKWLADLAGLARDRLAQRGLRAIDGGGWCTVEDESRFFSHRRDSARHGRGGRMAAAIWIERGA